MPIGGGLGVGAVPKESSQMEPLVIASSQFACSGKLCYFTVLLSVWRGIQRVLNLREYWERKRKSYDFLVGFGETDDKQR